MRVLLACRTLSVAPAAAIEETERELFSARGRRDARKVVIYGGGVLGSAV